jgi:outer membrane immunogenic protein
MLRRLLAVSASVVSLAAAAQAADLYRAGGGYKDAPAPAPTWSGFYVGANAGGAWGETKAIDELTPPRNIPWDHAGGTFSAETSGFTGGVTGGYNWQSGRVVFGIEGDVGYLGVSGSGAYISQNTTSVTSDGGLYVSARGRLGYALDTALIYATGGYFGADLGSEVVDTRAGMLTPKSIGFQSGWTAGGGVELMLNSAWSMKLEYLHYDLGRDTLNERCCQGNWTQNFGIENKGDIVRIGANYHIRPVYEPLK